MGLFVHLGAHKTASTHLARSLEAREAELLAEGVVFLAPEQLRSEPLNLRVLLNEPEARPRRRAAAQDMLRDMIAEQRDVILSEELILGGIGRQGFLAGDGRIYPNAGARLAQALDLVGTRDATLLLAIRSPADFLTSTFGELLRHDGPLRIEEFLRGFNPAELRWSELVERLLRESGAARLICWRYEDWAEVRPEVLEAMLGPELAAMIPDLAPVRVGMSDAAYRALIVGGAEGRAARDTVGALRKAHPKRGAEDRLRVFPDAVHEECDRLYAEDCARIAAMPKVRFISPKSAGLKAARGFATSGRQFQRRPVVANPVQFIAQVRAEAAKITWPTRREVVTTTIMVLIMAALTSVFFFLVDLIIRFGLTEGLQAISG